MLTFYAFDNRKKQGHTSMLGFLLAPIGTLGGITVQSQVLSILYLGPEVSQSRQVVAMGYFHFFLNLIVKNPLNAPDTHGSMPVREALQCVMLLVSVLIFCVNLSYFVTLSVVIQ